jgi:hypothetical protein
MASPMQPTAADPSRPDEPAAWRGLGDFAVLALLALVLGLQLLEWSQLEGYQLADSVEYMERAQALVRGQEVIDSTAIRSFGFVSVLAPIFWLADLLGVEDFKPVVGIVRLLQMGLGLALVHATARLAARLAGRRAGLVAGLAVGVNPYFLLYSVSPVSGIAAGLCVALALDSLLREEGPRRALVGGLWLGAALLMAYKTMLIALAILGLMVLVGRRREWRRWGAAWAGYLIGIVGAIGLDRLCYGEWGKSLDLYARMNFGPLGTRFAARFGFMDLARWFWEYADGERNQYYAAPDSTPKELLHEPNPLYHLTHLHEMVVWPLLVLLVLGVLWTLARGTRAQRILLAVFAGCAALVSLKSSNDFRLLLPLLACIGVLCGLGWEVLASRAALPSRGLRVALGAGLVLAGSALGQARLAELNSARFGGYWRAMRVVDALAEQREERDRPLVVACAWHWAVYLRESSGVELRKLPHQLDRWRSYDDAQRGRDLAALRELDVLIAHLAVLLEHPSLFRAVNEEFEVETMLYDREAYQDVGPILVLRRRTGGADARAFLSRTVGEAPLDYLAARQLHTGRRFLPGVPEEDEAPLTLLGWSYEPLPWSEHGWLSLHWYCDRSERATGFVARSRLTSEREPLPWEEEHALGRGLLPSSEWEAGEVISEGWPVVAAVAPFDWSQPWRPLAGEALPGSPVEATLWLRLVPRLATGERQPPLVPVTNDGGVRVTRDKLDSTGRGPDGLRVTAEGFVELGTVELRASAD